MLISLGPALRVNCLSDSLYTSCNPGRFRQEQRPSCHQHCNSTRDKFAPSNHLTQTRHVPVLKTLMRTHQWHDGDLSSSCLCRSEVSKVSCMIQSRYYFLIEVPQYYITFSPWCVNVNVVFRNSKLFNRSRRCLCFVESPAKIISLTSPV